MFKILENEKENLSLTPKIILHKYIETLVNYNYVKFKNKIKLKKKEIGSIENIFEVVNSHLYLLWMKLCIVFRLPGGYAKDQIL